MTDLPSPRGPSPRPTNRGMVAGSLLVATVLICAGIGAALGALAGSLAVGLVAGVFVGFPLGVVVVRKRFTDL